MKLTPALIDEGLRKHHEKMDRVAERLTNELWDRMFGHGLGDAPTKRRYRCSNRAPAPLVGPFDDEGDDEDDEN